MRAQHSRGQAGVSAVSAGDAADDDDAATRARRPAPLCTTCAYPAPYVYTTYTSRSNIRLGVCPRCGAFIDPLIEAPPLLLALDLVLLKPRVFLHLLFNRGSPPRDAGVGDVKTGVRASAHAHDNYDRAAGLRHTLVRLAVGTVIAETTVRVLRLPPSAGFADAARTAAAVSLELAAQLAGSTAIAMAFLSFKKWYPPPTRPRDAQPSPPPFADTARDGRQEGFLPVLVSLVLLHTALIPLVLQLVLEIWYAPAPRTGNERPLEPLIDFVAAYLPLALPTATTIANAWASADRVWAGTRLLSGMSAGFGLRVLLPTRPWETTSVVLAGWFAALAAAKAWQTLCDAML